MKQEPGRRQPGIPVLQGGEDVNEWMQFMIAKKKDRAHVFQRDPNKKSVLYSLCLRWQVRKIRNTGLSALEKANQDRPHCKLCEKRLKEIHNG